MIFSSCYIMVDYDRASMTGMISTSVRIGSLVQLMMTSVKKPKLIIISKADHIEDHEGNVIRKRKKFKGKTKEQDKHEENRQDDIEDIIDESWKTLIEQKLVKKLTRVETVTNVK